MAQDKLFVALSDGRVRGIVFVQGGAQRILRGLPLSGEDRAGSARQRGGSAGFAGRGGTGRSPPELVRGIKGRLPAFWIPALPPAVTLATSGDGRSLLVTCPRGTNRVFDVSGAAPRLYRRWERKSGSGEGLTHDGKMLVRGDVRGQVRGYALEEYKLLWLIPAQGVVMSPDGRWALCRKGKTLTIHSGDTGRQVGKTHRASGEILAMATASSELPAWVEKSSGGCSLRVPGGPPRALPCGNKTALSYSPTGDLLAVSLGDRVQLHHGRSGELLAQHQRTGATLTAIPLDSRTYVVAGLEPDRVTWFRLPAP